MEFVGIELAYLDNTHIYLDNAPWPRVHRFQDKLLDLCSNNLCLNHQHKALRWLQLLWLQLLLMWLLLQSLRLHLFIRKSYIGIQYDYFPIYNNSNVLTKKIKEVRMMLLFFIHREIELTPSFKHL